MGSNFDRGPKFVLVHWLNDLNRQSSMMARRLKAWADSIPGLPSAKQIVGSFTGTAGSRPPLHKTLCAGGLALRICGV